MKENQKGFTLIELLIVLVVMGIITAVLLPAQSIVSRQKLNTDLQFILTDIQSTQAEAQKGKEKTYLLNETQLSQSMTSKDYEIIGMDNTPETLTQLKFEIDSRGRFYIQNATDKKYIKELHITLETDKLKKKIVISGITGALLESTYE